MQAPGHDDLTVDIVMRTKDRSLLLARALDDVLAQTHDSWFLTVVNDGGDPAAVDRLVAERSSAWNGRVRVLHHPVSRGMEAAANAAIRTCDHPWVAIHDDDDTWDPRFLERTAGWLAAHPEAPAVAVRTEIVWERIEGESVRELSRETFLPDLTHVTLAQFLRFNCCVPISLLYRRAVLESVGLFDEHLAVVGDWECNVRLAVRGPFGFVAEEPLAFWHQRPGLGGALGNSVITQDDAHRRADREVRDRELRVALQRDGTGLPLYLTRFIDDRFDELHRRLDGFEGRFGGLEDRHDRQLAVRLRRFAGRVLRRGGRS